jgi:hypothetical protein
MVDNNQTVKYSYKKALQFCGAFSLRLMLKKDPSFVGMTIEKFSKS